MFLLYWAGALFIIAVLLTARHLRKHKITRQAVKLRRLLGERKIKARLEHWDGAKHVDLFIPAAKLNIEVDGSQHFLDAAQILSDLRRDCASCRINAYTFRVPNTIIERYADELADTLAIVVKRLKAGDA